MPTTQLNPDDQQSLTRDVQQFFASQIHSGYISPFTLDKVVQGPWGWEAIPANTNTEDIDDHDAAFDKGLRTIGAKYGVALHLPAWLYEK